jgi:hypothetical protein
MKKSLSFFIPCLLLIAALAACSKENEQALMQQTQVVCDTVNTRYLEDVVPILQANCYSCHGNGSTGGSGGILLDGYANLKPWATNGFLVGNVTHAPGFVAMPFGLPKLPDCEVNKIVDWVNRGAINN